MARKMVQEERRIQILRALYRCIQKKPFAETSIRDIAKEAKVNHGVLHYYFRGKEDILLNFIDYVIEDYRGQYMKWLESRDPGTVSSPGFIRECLDFMADRITLNRGLSKAFVEIWEIAAYNAVVRKKLRRAYDEWIGIISGVLENAGLSCEEAARSTRLMIAMYEGLALFSVIMPAERFDVADLLDWFRDHAGSLVDRGER